MNIYLVGGAVRDTLLGQKVSEKDWVVVGSTPEAMLKLGFKQVGKQFPVFIHPKTNEEYALARTEYKTSHGYHGFEFDSSPGISIEEDLRRRDLTINAIAQDEYSTLIDPWGGQKDIKEGKIRHISDAFAEDPVRILRVARFAARFYALGFRIVPETLDLMKKMVINGEADYLVAERVWQETAKAFATDYPAVYLKVLLDVGALTCIAPEINTLLRRIDEATVKDNINKTTNLFKALNQAPKKSPAILLAIMSFYAYRNGISITTLSDRWKLSKICRWMINATERFDDRLKSITNLSDKALLEFLRHMDAIRKRERFEDLLIAYKSSTSEIFTADDLAYITRVLDALVSVKLDVTGVTGKFAKARMHKLQLKAINSL